jgi:tetratricopeptide (TPR) repeat protein
MPMKRTPFHFGLSAILVAVAVLGFFIAGCQRRGVFLDVKRPAKLTMPGVKTIAVVDLESGDSALEKGAAAHVKEALVAGIRKEQAIKVMDLKTLQEDGGQKIDGVITGQVWCVYNKEEKRFETALRSKKITVQDGSLPKVVESRDYVEYVPYRTVRAFLKVRLALVTFKGKQEETMAVLSEAAGYREKIGGIRNVGFFDLFSSDSQAQTPSLGEAPGPIFKALAERVVPRFIATISPHTERVTVAFAENGDARGLDLIKRGRYVDAVAVLEKICVGKRPTKDNAPDFYNLGLAHEALGTRADFDMARDYYRQAIQGDPESPLYPEGLGRIETLVRDYYKITEQIR